MSVKTTTLPSRPSTYGLKRSVPGFAEKVIVDKRAVGHYTYSYPGEMAAKAKIGMEVKYEILRYIIDNTDVSTMDLADGVLCFMDSTASGDMIRSYSTAIAMATAIKTVQSKVAGINDGMALLLVRTAYELGKVAITDDSYEMPCTAWDYEPSLIGSVTTAACLAHLCVVPFVDNAIRKYLDAVKKKCTFQTDSTERIQWDKVSLTASIADALDDMISDILKQMSRADTLARSSAIVCDWYLAHPEEVKPQVAVELLGYKNITKSSRPLVPVTQPTPSDLSNAQTYISQVLNFVTDERSHFEIKSRSDVARALGAERVKTDLVRGTGPIMRVYWAHPATVTIPTATIRQYTARVHKLSVVRKIGKDDTTAKTVGAVTNREVNLDIYKISRVKEMEAHTTYVGDFTARLDRLLILKGDTVRVKRDVEAIDVDHRVWFDLLDDPYPETSFVAPTVKMCLAIELARDVYMTRVGGQMTFSYVDVTCVARNDGLTGATRRPSQHTSWRKVVAGALTDERPGASLFTHTALLNLEPFSKTEESGKYGAQRLPSTLVQLTAKMDAAGVVDFDNAPRIKYKAYNPDNTEEERSPFLSDAFGHEAIVMPSLYAEVPLDCSITLKQMAKAMNDIHAMTSLHTDAQKCALDIVRIAHDIASPLFGSYATGEATAHLASQLQPNAAAYMTLLDEAHAYYGIVGCFSGWLSLFSKELGSALASLLDDVRSYYEPEDIIGKTLENVATTELSAHVGLEESGRIFTQKGV